MSLKDLLRPGRLSQRFDRDAGVTAISDNVLGMIAPWERRALSCFAERIWTEGGRRDGLIIDGGPFVGASTMCLAEGLSRSGLTEAERLERICSYDLFLTTRGMAEGFFAGKGPAAGESFRPVFETNVAPFRQYIRVQEGDIRTAPVPDRPVSILFLDILWNWDATRVVSEMFYPRLEPGRSLLIHQDFVYPFYPWIVLSMGMLELPLRFAYNVPYSSVVFDVASPVRRGQMDDPRNLSVKDAVEIYDGFIDRLEGWGQGALALGKALFLASHNRTDVARRIVASVQTSFAEEPLTLQYVEPVLGYCDRTERDGRAQPLDELSGF